MFAAPGQLIDVGGCSLHLVQQGAGAPTVVLESGVAGSLLSWSLVQPAVAEFARVCSYDRAGLGWSDRCARPRTIEQMVSELASLLEQAGVSPPYILVGHSFGGLLIRAFAHLRPREVAGLVFVDPVSLVAWAHSSPQDQQRLQQGIRLSRRGAWLARLGLVRLALWTLVTAGPRVPKLIANLTAGRGSDTLNRLTGEVRRSPPEVWPLVRFHWSRPKSFEAMASYLECLPTAAAEALKMPLRSSTPFIVLSAGNATQAELLERDEWIAASRAGEHRRLHDSGHWIQLDQPAQVVRAVREIWERASGLQKSDSLS